MKCVRRWNRLDCVKMLTITDVIETLTGIRPETTPRGASQVVTDVVVDSIQVIPGAAYFCLPGASESETHLATALALERGASVVVFSGTETQLKPGKGLLLIDLVAGGAGLPATLPAASQTVLRVADSLAALQKLARAWRSRFPVKMIVITGSVGKTTTKELAAEVLQMHYRTATNSGLPNSAVQVPLGILRLASGCQRALFEVELPQLLTSELLTELLRPEVVILTNISPAHTAQGGAEETIARLATWLARLPEGSTVLFNIDDPWLREMASIYRQGTRQPARLLTYGLDEQADLWADWVESQGLEGIHFQLHSGSEALYIKVPLIGRHSVHTALRAAGIGMVEGLTWDDIIQGLRYGNLQLRLMAVRSPGGALILDDTYNASPESTLAALNLLNDLYRYEAFSSQAGRAKSAGRKIAVLSGMPGLGIYERQGHEMVGLRAAQVVDQLITVGKLGHQVAAAARSAWLPNQAIVEVNSAEQAVDYFGQNPPGAADMVLVKGSREMHMDLIAPALEVRK